MPRFLISSIGPTCNAIPDSPRLSLRSKAPRSWSACGMETPFDSTSTMSLPPRRRKSVPAFDRLPPTSSATGARCIWKSLSTVANSSRTAASSPRSAGLSRSNGCHGRRHDQSQRTANRGCNDHIGHGPRNETGDRREANRLHSCARSPVTQALEGFLQALSAGLLIGAVYGLMCVGLGLIFGVMRVINFAQGDFMMLGMYAVFYLFTSFGIQAAFGNTIGPFVAILLAGPVLALFGYLIHLTLISRVSGTRTAALEGEGHYAQLILTLGIALVLQNGGLIVFGSVLASIRTPLSSSAWEIGPLWSDDLVSVFINKARGIAALISIAAMIALTALITRTRM